MMSPRRRSSSEICVAVAVLTTLVVATACSSSLGGAQDAGSQGGSGAGPAGGGGGPAGAARGLAGGGGRGGSGGAAGTAAGGRGGGAAGIAGVDRRMPNADCAGTVNSPVAPLVQDVTLVCAPRSAGFSSIRVASGAAGRGYVVYNSSAFGPPPARVVTIDSAGRVSTETGPQGVENVLVLPGPAGTPILVGGPVTGDGIALYSAEPTEWRREPITPPPGANRFQLMGARIVADGRVFVAYYSFEAKAFIATRAATGGWTETMIPDATFGAALVVDSLARPHAIYGWQPAGASDGDFGIYDWYPGAARGELSYPLVGTVGVLAAAPVSDGRIAASVMLDAGIHVIAPDATGNPRSLTLPNTQRLVVTGCPVLPAAVNANVPPMMCTETGEGTTAQAIVSTADGKLWLAYLHRRIDRDVVQSCPLFETTYLCRRQIMVERSTSEIVVVRVPPDGTTPTAADIRWRTPVLITTPDSIAIDASGSKLTLAIDATPMYALASAFRYVVIETNGL